MEACRYELLKSGGESFISEVTAGWAEYGGPGHVPHYRPLLAEHHPLLRPPVRRPLLRPQAGPHRSLLACSQTSLAQLLKLFVFDSLVSLKL